MKKTSLLITILLSTLFSVAHTFAENNTLASGSLQSAFSSWGKASLQGDWKIVKEGNALFIELDDNFKAKDGPDVKIFLSPTNASSITGKNATEGSVFIQQISDFEGNKRIQIPANVDLNQYQSLVFHCEAYSKLWGSSALTTP